MTISVGVVVFAYDKANFVTCVSHWAEIVSMRRKSVRRFGYEKGKIWRFNCGDES